MKRHLPSLFLASFLLAACHLGQSQNKEPQVIVVPTDEMSRQPSLGPATVATPAPAPAPQMEVAVATPSTPGTAPTTVRRHSYNGCNVAGPYIAITFDDGPHPTLTPKLLDMLKERNIKATFYVLGQNVQQYPDIMKRMVAEGHEVGNHSWNHPALTKLGAAGVKSQMDRTTEAIIKACGQRPATMRPPYGATNASLNKRLTEEFNMPVILWTVDPLDWKYRNADRVSNQIIENTRSGAIVLAHDIHPSTIAAMPKTLDALTAKGFKFVTVSELLAMDRGPELVKKDTPSQPAEKTP